MEGLVSDVTTAVRYLEIVIHTQVGGGGAKNAMGSGEHVDSIARYYHAVEVSHRRF